MNDDYDIAEIFLLGFIALMVILLSVMAGYELFKVMNPVICPEQLTRCVPAPWN